MHNHGITQLKVGDIELTIPAPKPSIKQQIMTISPQEMAIASKSAYGNHQAAMEIMNKQPTTTKENTEDKEFEELLFFHEKF